MQESGCEQCGCVGWRRDGEAVIPAGEEEGVRYVKYMELELGDGSGWVGECGHTVRPGSALELYLNVIPNDQPVPLQRNG